MLEGSARFADVRWFDEVDSTNRVLADLAREGAADGVVVVVDHQTAGRGRLGRRWEADPGSSLLAALLRHLERHLAAPAEAFLDAYRARSATLGRRVRIELGSKTVTGEAVAITADGHLELDDAGTRQVVVAGDVVHLHPEPG